MGGGRYTADEWNASAWEQAGRGIRGSVGYRASEKCWSVPFDFLECL